MLSQFNGLQMIKKKRDLPLLTAVSFDLLAGLPRPVPLISRIYNEQTFVMAGLGKLGNGVRTD